MPKQKGTKSKVSILKKYFPDSLRNKKLDPSTWSSCKENLSKYLQTENAKFLFEAIKDEYSILQGEGKDPRHISEYVDEYTVVWETIINWKMTYLLYRPSDPIEREILEEDITILMRNLGSALVPRKKGYYYYDDGLIHKYPDLKLHYRNPEEYVERFDKIRAAFDRRRKRNKLTNYDLEKMGKRNDAIKVFRELGEIDEEVLEDFIASIDFEKAFNVTNPTLNATSYISYVHSYLDCNNCRLGRPKHYTLYYLFLNATKSLDRNQ